MPLSAHQHLDEAACDLLRLAGVEGAVLGSRLERDRQGGRLRVRLSLAFGLEEQLYRPAGHGQRDDGPAAVDLGMTCLDRRRMLGVQRTQSVQPLKSALSHAEP